MTEPQPDGLDLREFLQILGRRIGVLVGVVVITCAAGLALTLLQDKQYTASASLLLSDPALDQALVGAGLGAPPSGDPQRQVQTNLDVASLEAIAAQSARRLGGGQTADSVSSHVQVEGNPESNLISIEATADRPASAARLANTFAQQYIAFTRDAARSKIRRAQVLLQGQIADLRRRGQGGSLLRSLRARADDLRVLASLQTGNGQLVQSAAPPKTPSSPKPVRNLMIAGFAGLLLGLGVALAVEQFDRRLKRPEDVEESFGLPLLGRVPGSKAISAKGTALGELPVADAESFRMISASLRYYAIGRNVRALLVTSATAEEGKTTVALYLAAAAAESGRSVLLLEADMRHPSLAAALGRPEATGLTSVLVGQVALGDVTVPVPVAPRVNGRQGQGAFDVVVAGALPPNPSQLVESAAMQDLLREAVERYELVILDTPPAAVVSDAIPLMSKVDGVIVVSRVGANTRDAARRLRDQLHHLNAPALGVVANFTDPSDAGYGYGYGERGRRSGG
jgi:capsular exopolysaccharide synthesis family protein